MKNEALHNSVLLSTKFKMPVPRKNYVVRHQLFEQLNRCHETQIIYVIGAAGTGKTTLLSSFIKESRLENIAWLSLDETNNNVFSFWIYFASAISSFLGEERENILSILRSNFEAAHMENILAPIINALSCEEDYYIVLDDMQYIEDNLLMRTIEFFLKNMPDNLHIFMLSRENPTLYLGEFAVSGKLILISGDKLRFSREESLQFLKETLKLSISDEAIKQMNDFAEGWIGGLQLVAAAGGVQKGIMNVAGSSIAAEYLTREIFKALTEKERRFLIVTGILSYFDEKLCICLMDLDNFQNMMENLMAKNLFIICIDEKQGIYRYHNILGEYLKQQFLSLPYEEQLSLRQKAAKALLERGDKEEALYHLLKAEDYNQIMRILRDMDETMETWAFINKLPLDYLIQDTNLCVQGLIYNLGSLSVTRGLEISKALEERYKGSELQKALQYFYFFIGIDRENFPMNTMSFDSIKKLNLSPVTQSMLLIGNACIFLGLNKYEECEQNVDYVLKAAGGANLCVDFYALSTKAQLLEETGRLNESLETYERMEKLIKSTPFSSGMGYSHYIGIIGLYHKRMEKDNAIKAIKKIENIVDSNHLPQFMMEAGYKYHISEYELLFGDAGKGTEIAYKLIKDYPQDSIQFDRLINEMLAQNRMDTEMVESLIKRFALTINDNASLGSKLVYARLLNKQGNTDAAMKLIEEILAFSRAHKNWLRLVEADLLKLSIIISSGSKQKRDMDNLLREALYYSWENRIIQPFFWNRTVLNPYLEQYYKSEIRNLSKGEQQFLKDVIKSCSGKAETNSKDDLSARELEVLRELAKGLTNPEIAEKLCISLATVKTHIINIFGKLGVSSRLAAVEEAKKRKII